MLSFMHRLHRSSSSNERAVTSPSSSPVLASPSSDSISSLDDVLALPFEQLPAERERRRMLHRTSAFRSHSAENNSPTSGVPFRMAVLRAGGLLTALGTRRQLVYASPDTSYTYEAMLALDENNPRRGVRKHVLDKLPTASLKRADPALECHICMENFKKGTKVVQLPCEHKYCASCIGKWLHNHITCPVCRYAFPDSQTIIVK